MALQMNMHHLLEEGKNREAVKVFESFVNEAFKEAARMQLLQGQLPVYRRPAEYQWLQYIKALSMNERVAVNSISAALALMRQVGIPPRNVHYQHYLEHLKRRGFSNRACEVIDEMIKSGIRPDTRCYEQAIYACLLVRDLESTSITTWKRSQVNSGWVLYTKVISFCASLKRIENALIFMRQMTDLQLAVPIHLLIDVAVNAAEVDDTAAVDAILHDIQSYRALMYMEDGAECHAPVRLDEGILLTVLNCAARTGQSFLADQAWTMLKDCLTMPYSHEIETATFSTADKESKETPSAKETTAEGVPHEAEDGVEDEEEEDLEQENHDEGHTFIKKPGASKEDEWKEILRPLLHDDVPLVESYHAFIEAQAKAGNVERAFEAVLELEENYPTNPADSSPAQGLCMLVDELSKDASTVDEAYLLAALLFQLSSEEKKVTVTMLDVIVSACSRMGDATRAFETFEAYPKLGLQHRTESYNALMEVCANQRQVEVIMKLLQEMTKSGIKPNVDTYMQIVEGYVNNGDTAGISHALNITRREGFVPTLRVLERALECADKFNDDRARQLVRREMLSAGQLFNVTFRGRGRGGRPYRGRGRGFQGRGSSYPPSQEYPGRGFAPGRRPPVQTYVGARTPRPPPSTDQQKTSNQPPHPSPQPESSDVDASTATSES